MGTQTCTGSPFLHPDSTLNWGAAPTPPQHAGGCPWSQRHSVLSLQVQAEIKRNWGKWQSSMESNVFNLATQDFTA